MTKKSLKGHSNKTEKSFSLIGWARSDKYHNQITLQPDLQLYSTNNEMAAASSTSTTKKLRKIEKLQKKRQDENYMVMRLREQQNCAA